VAALVVVVLAAGGGAYALISSGPSGHPAAGPSARPSSGAVSQAAVAAASTTAIASTAASVAPTQTPTPSPSPTPTATPSPSPTASGTVAVAASVAANPAAPQVTALLNRYFNAINTRNYAEYSSVLNAQMQAENPPASFASGYATTKDTAETVTAISSTGGGDLTVTVSFTSQQSPADSIDDSPCNNWLLNLYLVPQGNGYVISPHPPGYQPTHSDC
jgi:hypothetical protein